MPLSGQGKGGGSSHDPGMIMGQNPQNFQQLQNNDGSQIQNTNDSANKYKQSKYV